jgi:hypothetical protein
MLSEDQEIDILIKYEDGVSRERIAREVGCAVSTAYEVIRRGCTRRIWCEKYGDNEVLWTSSREGFVVGKLPPETLTIKGREIPCEVCEIRLAYGHRIQISTLYFSEDHSVLMCETEWEREGSDRIPEPKCVAAYYCTGCHKWVTWEPCQVCRARRGVDKPR